MDVLFEASFAKDLKRVKDKQLLKRVQNILEHVKVANSLSDISNLKKLQGYDSYFRLRLGDYRIGIEVEGQTVVFVRILHRKDIYQKFP
ncbi:type II toxin-antitoxin system RelE family toxin [Candidatus Leptofilum sp.]|uniref:type II toxin-antitoxin system RelE family toxin n=1 Tax=Candidatus Leptofilum sp. TaxID=3241576 RepID=UPI003B596DB1